jgi:hypothetical protein
MKEDKEMTADKRFKKVYSQGAVNVTEIWVDQDTGVTIYSMQVDMLEDLRPCWTGMVSR